MLPGQVRAGLCESFAGFWAEGSFALGWMDGWMDASNIGASIIRKGSAGIFLT